MLKNVPTKCPSPKGAGGSGHMVELTWVQFDPKGHFDRFIRFCRAQQCVQHTDGQTDHTTSLTTGPLFSLRHNNKSVSSLLRRLSTSYRFAFPARRALSSKPAERRCCCRSTGDRRRDARPLQRPCSAHYAGSVSNKANICMAQNKAVALGEQTLPAVGNLPPLFIRLRRQKSI